MAWRGVWLDREKFRCPICLDLLKDPVTTSCGHSYCRNCIQSHWDEEDEKEIHSCPQCRQTFTPRPVLMINTMLAALVEELTKPGLQADRGYAGPEDVACDFCTGRQLKALKSCLFCLASYCEKHLQPHYDETPLKQHKLVKPCKMLQENICYRHDEVMKMFCRTDQQCICYLCSVDEHKGHDTVSAAAERTERQEELEVSRQNIQQRIQDRAEHVTELKEEMEDIGRSVDKALQFNEETFTTLFRIMRKRSCDMKQQIRAEQQTEVSRVRELQEKLQQEIAELQRTDAELEQLSHTEDHTKFLHIYPSLAALTEAIHSSSMDTRPLRDFEDVTTAVSEFTDKLQDILTKKLTYIVPSVTEVGVLPRQPEPKTRDDLLKYARQITLDPNTASSWLLLSEGNRKVTRMREQQSYSDHPDRFTDYFQVLSRESLTGRCYWEVEWSGEGVNIAVAYKSIGRVGTSNECEFGCNDKSLVLYCCRYYTHFYYKSKFSQGQGSPSSRIGVYLDHSVGILSFYNISKTMELLHCIKTEFTEPLYAGLAFSDPESTAEFV